MMRKNNAIRPNMFAQCATNTQKWMNLAVRSQISTRTASSQIPAVNEGKLQYRIPSGLSESTISHDVPTAELLDLLKRVLGPRKHEIWSSVVQRLQDSHGKRRCLGVLDLSNLGSSSLINSLIGGRDITPAVRQALDSRWASLPESTSRLVIRNGERVAKFGSILEVPSQMLAKSNAELLEVRDSEYAAHLILAHLPVIILRPGVHPSLPSLKHKKGSIILLEYDEASATGVEEPIHSDQFPRFMTYNRSDPHKLVSQLYEILSRVDAKISPQAAKRTALRGMLDECSTRLELSLRELEAIQLQAAAFATKEGLLLDQLRAKFEAIDLSAEMQDNKVHLLKQISSFGRFRFWDMDDFSEELQAYVIANYGVELERKLEWFTGSMSTVQERLHQVTNDYLNQIQDVLDAAPLTNQVYQLESTQLPVPPSCFTAPILNRRRQLANIATPHMQSRYLRRVYTAMLATPLFTGVPAILWANGMLDGSVALPAAILGALLCVRHISKAWEKGRSKWLADYDRIQIGLSEDIQRVVQEMLEQRLKVVPLAALEGSTRLIVQRDETIKALAAELKKAESMLPQ